MRRRYRDKAKKRENTGWGVIEGVSFNVSHEIYKIHIKGKKHEKIRPERTQQRGRCKVGARRGRGRGTEEDAGKYETGITRQEVLVRIFFIGNALKGGNVRRYI